MNGGITCGCRHGADTNGRAASRGRSLAIGAGAPLYHGPVFSVSPAEFATIAIVAIIVIGPKRLPDLARRAGAMLRAVRRAMGELKSGIENEYEEAVAPLKEMRDEYRETVAPLKEMKDEIGSMLDPPPTPEPPRPEKREPPEQDS